MTCIVPVNCCYYFSFSSFPLPHFLHFAVFSFDCLHFPSWGERYLGHPKTLRKHLKESCFKYINPHNLSMMFSFLGNQSKKSPNRIMVYDKPVFLNKLYYFMYMTKGVMLYICIYKMICLSFNGHIHLYAKNLEDLTFLKFSMSAPGHA